MVIRLKKILIIFASLGIVFALIYIVVRLILFLQASYFWYDKLLGILLLGAEGFGVIHIFGFMLNILKLGFAQKKIIKNEKFLKLKEYPEIVIVIPSYKERLDIVEKTLISCYNVEYPNKRIVLLDDTR